MLKNYLLPTEMCWLIIRADLANSAKKKDVRDRASAFWNALEPISDEFNKIETVQLTGEWQSIFAFLQFSNCTNSTH